MSAERSTTEPEAWTQWEGQVVDGRFALRRCLGYSEHSAVFLTEHKAKDLAEAAIKLVRADAPQATALLARWQAAAVLSHPHLIRLFEVGRCQFAGRDSLFVVMEYAEQTLAEILRRRALTADEVQELLPPILDALTFLHRRQLILGGLKPANVLAVGDQLKLASDTLRPANHSASSDIWSLGVTLFEALTQRAPASGEHRFDVTQLPPGLPAPLVDTVRRCLNPTPADRPTVIELRAEYKPAEQKPVEHKPAVVQANRPTPPAPTIQPALSLQKEISPEPSPPQDPPKRFRSPWIIVTALVIASAVWLGSRFTGHSDEPMQPAVTPASVAPSVPAKVAPARSTAKPTPVISPPPRPAPPSEAVVREVTPNVPSAIQAKIQGRIYVTVRVLVDSAGNVMGAVLENPGPSKYFARLADETAREWQFVPVDTQEAPRVWLLRFEFTRGGVTARTIAQ